MDETQPTRIARTEILQRIEALLSEISGIGVDEIKADQKLASSPLNYNDVAKMALAARLAARFPEAELGLTPTETASCEVVRDLRILLERKLKSAGVEVSGGSIFGKLS